MLATSVCTSGCATASKPTAVQKAVELIKQAEGFSPIPYKDGRYGYSWGYGHYEIGISLPKVRVSKDEAYQLLLDDLPLYVQAAESMPGYTSLSSLRQAVLIDMTYNLGTAWYKGWPRFMKALSANDVVQMTKEMRNSRWYRQVKSRAVRNIEIMLNNRYRKVSS